MAISISAICATLRMNNNKGESPVARPLFISDRGAGRPSHRMAASRDTALDSMLHSGHYGWNLLGCHGPDEDRRNRRSPTDTDCRGLVDIGHSFRWNSGIGRCSRNRLDARPAPPARTLAFRPFVSTNRHLFHR